MDHLKTVTIREGVDKSQPQSQPNQIILDFDILWLEVEWQFNLIVSEGSMSVKLDLMVDHKWQEFERDYTNQRWAHMAP